MSTYDKVKNYIRRNKSYGYNRELVDRVASIQSAFITKIQNANNKAK